MFAKLHRKYRYSLILLRELVITDFKLRYQNSVLGYLWALLKPLFLFIILYVFIVKILGIGKGVPHWGTALLLGIVMWSFFQEVVKQGLQSVAKSGGIIRKINFPKYIIVVSTSLSAVINLLINLVVVAILGAVTHVPLSWGMLLIPVFIIELYILGIGLAFFLGATNVRFRDVGYIWDVFTQALFYGSAIMFPLNRVIKMSHEAAVIMMINPVSQAIQDSRHYAISHKIANVTSVTDNIYIIIIPFIIVVIVAVLGAAYFRYRSPHFAEEV